MSLGSFRPFVQVLLAAVLLAGRASAQVELPGEELAHHFKGGKEGHAYTLAMLELGMRMGAATTAAMRDDKDRARKSIKAFKDQYGKVAAMVPAWKGQFRPALIDELDAAVAGGKADAAARKKIVARIEGSCTTCHAKYMAAVQARFRWGNFGTATVGEDKGGLTLHQIMLDLANSLGAVRSDVEAGQFAEAQGNYKQFVERFNSMDQLCQNCHDQPRQYFIDAAVKARVYKIGGLLRRGEANGAEYAPLFKDLNEMSCLPCHQVHMPAAFQQEYMRELKRQASGGGG